MLLSRLRGFITIYKAPPWGDGGLPLLILCQFLLQVLPCLESCKQGNSITCFLRRVLVFLYDAPCLVEINFEMFHLLEKLKKDPHGVSLFYFQCAQITL